MWGVLPDNRINTSSLCDGFVTHGAKHDKQALVSCELKKAEKGREVMEDCVQLHRV